MLNWESGAEGEELEGPEPEEEGLEAEEESDDCSDEEERKRVFMRPISHVLVHIPEIIRDRNYYAEHQNLEAFNSRITRKKKRGNTQTDRQMMYMLRTISIEDLMMERIL